MQQPAGERASAGLRESVYSGKGPLKLNVTEIKDPMEGSLHRHSHKEITSVYESRCWWCCLWSPQHFPLGDFRGAGLGLGSETASEP
jgi:hypothetical protein